MGRTNTVGVAAELKVAASLTEAGWQVSLPFGENAQYDLVADDGNSLFRVQVKSVRITDGVLNVRVISSVGMEYRGKVDAVCAYCPCNGKVYWIDLDALENRSYVTLRVDGVKNNQSAKVRLARDFELEARFAA